MCYRFKLCEMLISVIGALRMTLNSSTIMETKTLEDLVGLTTFSTFFS